MSETAPQPPAENIQNYLVHAILVTLFCCLPLGIVSIIFASQVNTKLAAGDIEGAREASAKAKKFWVWALIAGLAVIVIYTVLMVVGIAAGVAEGGY